MRAALARYRSRSDSISLARLFSLSTAIRSSTLMRSFSSAPRREGDGSRHAPWREVIGAALAAVAAVSVSRAEIDATMTIATIRTTSDLSAFHHALSSSAIRSWSRSASICAAVSAPRSVTIRSSTRMRSWSCCTWPRSRSFSRSSAGDRPASRASNGPECPACA